MKCIHCQAELEEGVTLCPECGTENAEAQAVEETAETVQAPEETVQEQTPEEIETQEEETNEIREGVKATPGKIAIAVAAVVVLVAVLAALIVAGIASWAKEPAVTDPTTETSANFGPDNPATEATIPADGNPEEATCKGSYTASDDEILAAGDTVVATVGDKTLTIRELQVYYWMQAQQFMNSESGYYAYYMGAIDMTQPRICRFP